MIRFPHEKKRGRYVSQSMARFSDFIVDNELIDLPLVGRKFTWTNNQAMAAMSRIDRFLFSKEWEVHFSGVSQVALPRVISDHCPIKLCPNVVNWGPKPFRFENCWLLHRFFTVCLRVLVPD